MTVGRWVLAAVAVTSLGTVAAAQVPEADQRCIVTFNDGVREVGKQQGKIVAKCLRSFAGGNLATAPEVCLIVDPTTRLQRATDKALAKTTAACVTTPAFGVTPTPPALARGAIGEIDLLHGAIGPNLDTALVPSALPAGCQSRVGAALLKCADMRRRTFTKCVKDALKAGVATDAASLEAACLGSGDALQPDPSGRIAKACGEKVARTVAQRCIGVDLTQAFPACATGDPLALGACLQAGSGCQLCRLANDVAGLGRDCDRLDDGNGGNGSCVAECGDGIVQVSEGCDDGDVSGGDGCSDTCDVELGWSCTGAPSACTVSCGNGAVDAGETCDDGDATGGDGCSAACTVEAGWTCAGAPSVCTPICGNGALDPGEMCDDADTAGGDGCSAACQTEPGWLCAGQPSVCTFVCGNGTFQAGESCDDGDATGGDGCSAACQIEPGWLCSGQPSLCAPLCGDGVLRGGETCDDGNPTSGDGCSFLCQVEAGFACTAEPSNCLAICGDGFIRGTETCDDADTAGGDGCSGALCRQEVGWTCLGQPSVCIFDCGDGNLDGLEECDDGGTTGGDGCSAICRGEPGWACGGTPSICVFSCGNGALDAGETCDDGNALAGDGCSASCRNESGWLCSGVGVPCTQFEVFIDTPANGAFTTAGSALITGHYTTLPAGQAAVTINGVPAASVNPIARTFSHTVSLSAPAIFNPVRATLTNTANGDDVHDRITVIRGPSVADGAHSPQSVALRINDSGLDTLEPLVGALASSQLDLGTLLPPGTVLADECFINAIGCWGSAQVRIASPAPSYSSLALALDSKTNAVGANITVSNLRVDVDIDGSGLVPDCRLRLTAAAMPLTGDYALQPAPGDPSNVDVNLVGAIGVSFAGFNYQFTSGLCDAPIIGDIIQALLPDIEDFATNGIRGFLADPDGGGPQDSPIADAIETTLADISISGPIGSGLGLQLDSPLFQVAEDNSGITLGADARFTVSVGGGPGQCLPPPGAPNLTASYAPAAVFPPWGATTPVGGIPYGLGIGVSPAAFNQLLRGQIECGLMRTSLTTIDLDGAGGAPPLPITSTLLSLLVPEFGQLPANTPLRVDIAPMLAPVVTGDPGPNGELTELRIAQVAVEVVQPGPGIVWLGGAFDARLGMSLAFLPDGSGLAVTLSEPAAADTTMAITYNPLGASEAQLESVLPGVIRPLIPQLAGALSGFPLPQFFGLNLGGVGVSPNGDFLALFANLTPAP